MNEVKDLNAMTPEQQRIAIAEACGWKRRNSWSAFMDKGDEKGVLPPDYLNSLDAMHEAEKVLTKQQFGVYLDHLIELPGPYSYVCATAAQRAKAFLRTLNLWKDSP